MTQRTISAAEQTGVVPTEGDDSLTKPQMALALVAGALWVGSWWLIWMHFMASSSTPEKPFVPMFDVPYFITIGFSVGLITLATFGSFYVTRNRSADESMRSAIAAALVVFYVVLVTDLLVVPGFLASLGEGTPASGEQEAVESFGQGLVTGLSAFVGVIIAFYFASSAVADKAKTDAKAKVEEARMTAQGSVAERVRALTDLRGAGLVTDEEYKATKVSILASA